MFQYGGDGAYWRAALKGGPRYDLGGQASGEVTVEEQEQAKRELEAMLARRKAQRNARRQAETAASGGNMLGPVSHEPATSVEDTLRTDYP